MQTGEQEWRVEPVENQAELECSTEALMEAEIVSSLYALQKF